MTNAACMPVYTYTIASAASWIHDREDRVTAIYDRLLFHVESQDYFATLATILGFIEEKLAELERKLQIDIDPSLERTALREMHDDLMYLQKHYKIVGKKNRQY